MKLIDTNILIYSGQPAYSNLLLPFVTEPANSFSVISKVETLGFSLITPAQISYFESLFLVLQPLTVDDAVVLKSIELRRLKKMSLGDALIAATALVHGLELITRNTADFSGIAGLRVNNPIV